MDRFSIPCETLQRIHNRRSYDPVGSHASSSKLPPHLPTRNPPAAVPRSQPTPVLHLEATPSDPKMNWKEQGDFHLARNEADLAIEGYTKSLEKAEKQKNPAEIIDNLKNLGRAFLIKGQLVTAAKIFNGAFALCKKPPMKKHRRPFFPSWQKWKEPF